ncbi:hypothetical protein AB0C81_12285 [Streptomyces roseoverticillatus]|uniref:hypothetical protein n=1 Tax=Streptomyces roseoverticillatus TaxID=66429 RepID=UPI00340C9667
MGRHSGGNASQEDWDPNKQAERNLRTAGYTARVVCGDGEKGVAEDALYDRLICTAAARRIPRAWREQLRPGGIILTPYGSLFSSSGLLRLAVGPDGAAEGRFVHTASYMWLRAHRAQGGRPPRDGEEQLSASPSAPDKILDGDWHADFAIGQLIPGLTMQRTTGAGDRRILLWNGADSFASVCCDGWDEGDSVLEQGPRSLWGEVLTARSWWDEHGRPAITRFGLTVTIDREHHTWLDAPENRLPRGRTWSSAGGFRLFRLRCPAGSRSSPPRRPTPSAHSTEALPQYPRDDGVQLIVPDTRFIRSRSCSRCRRAGPALGAAAARTAGTDTGGCPTWRRP